MEYFRCKMCGADLNITTDSKIVHCEYCGSSQTVPAANDEKKINLFNRANKMRMLCEFDKANILYENIISEFPDEAEAYWGICLCKYGVEYVDDPKTKRKIPTLHRASKKSILDDDDYRSTIEKSDVIAKDQYEIEAKAIDKINLEMNEIAKKEKPYDIFICYKETDMDGARTKDSVYAQNIYDVLTKKGYNIFFARITLEDKLGEKYEPYIFSALSSAKIMLAVGTKPEYFDSIWVKNEWSRFLDLMQQDKSKKLFPCYRDMDAYDLPIEFKNLQAQDMSKIGFEQDLARNIEKIIPINNTAKKAEPVYNSERLDILIPNAQKLVELGNFGKAEEIYDKIILLAPDNYNGWLGKIMCLTQNFTYTDFTPEEEKLFDRCLGTLRKTANDDILREFENQLVQFFQNVVCPKKADAQNMEFIKTIKVAENKIKSFQKDKNDDKEKLSNIINSCNNEIVILKQKRKTPKDILAVSSAYKTIPILSKVTGKAIPVLLIASIIFTFIPVKGVYPDLLFIIMLICVVGWVFLKALFYLYKIKATASNITPVISQSELSEYRKKIDMFDKKISEQRKLISENDSIVQSNLKYYDDMISKYTNYINNIKPAIELNKDQQITFFLFALCEAKNLPLPELDSAIKQTMTLAQEMSFSLHNND